MTQHLAIDPEVLNQAYDTNWDCFTQFMVESNCRSVKDRNRLHLDHRFAQLLGYESMIVPANQIQGRAFTLVGDKASDLKLFTGIPVNRGASWKPKFDLLIGEPFMVNFRITKARSTPLGTLIFVKAEGIKERNIRFGFGQATYLILPRPQSDSFPRAVSS